MSTADAHAAEAAPVFAALGDQARLALVGRLADGRRRSIVELSGGLGITRQGVTKHLRVLEAAGLVASARSGRETRFALRPERLDAARAYLEAAAAQWTATSARLEAFLDANPD